MLVSNNAIEIGIPIATILVSGLAAYFGAFIKTMAANDANNQNFEKVLEQMKTQTAEIENIKAAISDDVWDRQKQWELKRDGIFEVVQALGELEDALGSLHSVHSCQVPENEDSSEYLRGRLHDELISFDACNRKFSRAMFKTRLFAGKELHHALTECSEEIRSVSHRILTEETADITRLVSDASPRNVVKIDFETLIQKIMQAIRSARKSLGIELAE